MDTKMTPEELNKKSRRTQDMLWRIKDYTQKRGHPIKLRFVSNLFSKSFENLGGFQRTLLELEEMGDIKILYAATGSRYIVATEGELK